jgi:integrase
MAIFKRGRVYWYHFVFSGQHIQESTKQANPNVARQMEAAHRTSLAKGEVGIREKKRVSLAEFIESRFHPWCKSSFEHNSPRTWHSWYRPSLRAILDYPALSERNLNELTSEHAAAFAAHLQSRGLKTSSVNSRLRVLRRVLYIAVEWGVLDVSPKIRLFAGERHREHVVTPEEEAKYLAAASPLLSDVATVLIDSGMRPEECFRLLWENVAWTNARHCWSRMARLPQLGVFCQ